MAPAIKGGFLKRAGKIESIRIRMLKHPGTQHVEYHALVRISPVSTGKRVIKMLNRKPLNGKRINVSEFHFRHHSNDRRIAHSPVLADRRKGERRRLGLEIKDITDERTKAVIDYSPLSWKEDEK